MKLELRLDELEKKIGMLISNSTQLYGVSDTETEKLTNPRPDQRESPAAGSDPDDVSSSSPQSRKFIILPACIVGSRASSARQLTVHEPVNCIMNPALSLDDVLDFQTGEESNHREFNSLDVPKLPPMRQEIAFWPTGQSFHLRILRCPPPQP